MRAGDELNVRAAYGADKGWHGVARSSHQARIRAGGVEKDVTVQDAEQAVLDSVDEAYRKKYGARHAGIVDSITDAEHRAATLRLAPRSRPSRDVVSGRPRPCSPRRGARQRPG